MRFDPGSEKVVTLPAGGPAFRPELVRAPLPARTKLTALVRAMNERAVQQKLEREQKRKAAAE